MGRGGYNGGGPTVNEPKTDKLCIFTRSGDLDISMLRSSLITNAGQGLKNEHGAVQQEFGYIIDVRRTSIDKHSPKINIVQRIIAVITRTKKADIDGGTDIRWMAASQLLNKAPEGTDLIRNYQSRYPKAPRPWGFDKVKHNSG
jgi:hypothetical protein